jgi:two-component system sensor histidine kinase DesK
MTEDPLTGRTPPRHEVRIGWPPRNRRELTVKVLWIGVWLVFLSSPVHDLVSGHHTTGATVAGALGLAAFVGVYLSLVFRNIGRPFSGPVVVVLLAVLGILAPVLAYTLGSAWLGLFVYLSVACGATLPLRAAYWAIPATGAVMYLVGLHSSEKEARGLVLLVVLIGFAMTGVGQLVRTTIELRKARATVAQLAANEERLRLARDLHDLLGHSLSVVALKSELATRLLPDHPEQAAEHVRDIEAVSRRALGEVRDAVAGYRRPVLSAELAGARGALTAAGIEVEAGPIPAADLPPDAEAVLAWAVREGATTVLRHAGARHVRIRVDVNGRDAALELVDDGCGVDGGDPGTGLAGLAERVARVRGRMDAAPGDGGGFRLAVTVPLEAVS